MQPFPFKGQESGQVEAGEVETGIGPVFSFELLLVKWKVGLASFNPIIFAGPLMISIPPQTQRRNLHY